MIYNIYESCEKRWHFFTQLHKFDRCIKQIWNQAKVNVKIDIFLHQGYRQFLPCQSVFYDLQFKQKICKNHVWNRCNFPRDKPGACCAFFLKVDRCLPTYKYRKNEYNKLLANRSCPTIITTRTQKYRSYQKYTADLSTCKTHYSTSVKSITEHLPYLCN